MFYDLPPYLEISMPLDETQKDDDENPLRNPAAAMILEALRREGSTFGLELLETIADLTEGHLSVWEGNLYPLIKRLIEAGLIKKIDGEQRSSNKEGKLREYFELTEAGKIRADYNHRVMALMFDFKFRDNL